MTIGSLDLAILIAYLLATLVFGLWLGRGQKNAHDYLLGARNLPWWALLLSIVATETSTATFLSVPGIAFGQGIPGSTGDFRYLQLPIGYVVGRIVAAYVLLPLYFQGSMFTAYDVLRKRSGTAVRSIASALFLVTRTLADGLRLYLTSLVLQVMFGWDLGPSVLAVTGATVVYTVVGGIRAVVWTDVLQFFVYLVGAGATLLVLSAQLDGGLLQTFDTAAIEGRLRVLDFGFDLANPYTFWAGLFGGAVLTIGSHGVDQLVVQRYLSAKGLADARKALLWSGPVVLLQFALFLAIGMCLSYFYASHAPGEPFQKGDRIFPHFIVHHLPTGLVGIVLGAVFSAAMSTLSSSLSASAGALVNDFLLPLTGRSADSPYALKAARLATLCFAALQAAVGISGLGGGDAVVNQVLGIATITTGVILGLFLLALGRSASPSASLVGLCGGLVAIVFVVTMAKWSSVSIAWPWHGLVTCAGTMLVGLTARLWQHGNRNPS